MFLAVVSAGLFSGPLQRASSAGVLSGHPLLANVSAGILSPYRDDPRKFESFSFHASKSSLLMLIVDCTKSYVIMQRNATVQHSQ